MSAAPLPHLCSARSGESTMCLRVSCLCAYAYLHTPTMCLCVSSYPDGYVPTRTAPLPHWCSARSGESTTSDGPLCATRSKKLRCQYPASETVLSWMQRYKSPATKAVLNWIRRYQYPATKTVLSWIQRYQGRPGPRKPPTARLPLGGAVHRHPGYAAKSNAITLALQPCVLHFDPARGTEAGLGPTHTLVLTTHGVRYQSGPRAYTHAGTDNAHGVRTGSYECVCGAGFAHTDAALPPLAEHPSPSECLFAHPSDPSRCAAFRTELSGSPEVCEVRIRYAPTPCPRTKLLRHVLVLTWGMLLRYGLVLAWAMLLRYVLGHTRVQRREASSAGTPTAASGTDSELCLCCSPTRLCYAPTHDMILRAFALSGAALSFPMAASGTVPSAMILRSSRYAATSKA
eukprot:778150-Rhodomonas_salina.1